MQREGTGIMKQVFFRIGAALIAFCVGIGVTAGWSIFIYSTPPITSGVLKVTTTGNDRGSLDGEPSSTNNNVVRSMLASASADGSLGVIEYLLANGADIDAADENGSTALMYAAGHKRRAAMALLLKRGADPDLKDNKGRTASVYAEDGFP